MQTVDVSRACELPPDPFVFALVCPYPDLSACWLLCALYVDRRRTRQGLCVRQAGALSQNRIHPCKPSQLLLGTP